MVTEGVKFESGCSGWTQVELQSELVARINESPFLEEIEAQTHGVICTDITRLNDLFPSSIFVIKEDEFIRNEDNFIRLFGDVDLPKGFDIIILEQDGHNWAGKQTKRDLDYMPKSASNFGEFWITVRNHLVDMDPITDDGLQNLAQFEQDVQGFLDREVTIVPEKYHDRIDR